MLEPVAPELDVLIRVYTKMDTTRNCVTYGLLSILLTCVTASVFRCRLLHFNA